MRSTCCAVCWRNHRIDSAPLNVRAVTASPPTSAELEPVAARISEGASDR